ncbi:unnamed protein product [Paramecium octaurelia]|uniref:Uncharacterized protein n=1 Tax=Paramecium octaurelia TaxID=43137 RepID=A0A8S1UNW8_PAROT|nr:unnamed protein product [Paramecium octaurelia]
MKSNGIRILKNKSNLLHIVIEGNEMNTLCKKQQEAIDYWQKQNPKPLYIKWNQALRDTEIVDFYSNVARENRQLLHSFMMEILKLRLQNYHKNQQSKYQVQGNYFKEYV